MRTNADLEKWLRPLTEWIVTRTGIRERHIAAPNETVATWAFTAANRAIEMAGIDKGRGGCGGYHISNTVWPTKRGMSDSSMLGIKVARRFDVAAACASFTYALSIAKPVR